MDGSPRYLLAKAERLTKPVFIPRGAGPKKHPYEWQEQRDRLAPRALKVATAISELPALACPDDRSVAVVTLHPRYIAKSYFPDDLFRAAGLRAIGSRPEYVSPDKGASGLSTQIYVAGERPAFAMLAAMIPQLDSRFEKLLAIEDIRVQRPDERLKLVDDGDTMLEVVLHAPAGWDTIAEGFDAYLQSLGLSADVGRRHYVRDLCFMPVQAKTEQVKNIALFSFMRVARTMPRLREMRPATEISSRTSVTYSLPATPATDPGIRVAIFDGGLSHQSPLATWVKAKDADKIGPAVPQYVEHGTDVTSAALFGSLAGGEAATPYVEIDHYRVLDARFLICIPDMTIGARSLRKTFMGSSSDGCLQFPFRNGLVRRIPR